MIIFFAKKCELYSIKYGNDFSFIKKQCKLNQIDYFSRIF